MHVYVILPCMYACMCNKLNASLKTNVFNVFKRVQTFSNVLKRFQTFTNLRHALSLTHNTWISRASSESEMMQSECNQKTTADETQNQKWCNQNAIRKQLQMKLRIRNDAIRMQSENNCRWNSEMVLSAHQKRPNFKHTLLHACTRWRFYTMTHAHKLRNACKYSIICGHEWIPVTLFKYYTLVTHMYVTGVGPHTNLCECTSLCVLLHITVPRRKIQYILRRIRRRRVQSMFVWNVQPRRISKLLSGEHLRTYIQTYMHACIHSIHTWTLAWLPECVLGFCTWIDLLMSLQQAH